MVSVLSTEAQAAITPAGLSQFCLIAFGMGLVGCVNTFASQALGREHASDGGLPFHVAQIASQYRDLLLRLDEP